MHDIHLLCSVLCKLKETNPFYPNSFHTWNKEGNESNLCADKSVCVGRYDVASSYPSNDGLSVTHGSEKLPRIIFLHKTKIQNIS